jgi:hypothetical protein
MQCSKEAQELAQASLAKSTVKQYENNVRKFVSFMEEFGIGIEEISEITLIEFITQLAAKRFSYSYVRSIFAATLRAVKHKRPDLVIDPELLDQVLKGAASVLPKQVKANFTWDPDIVIDYLLKLPVPSDLRSLAAECAIIFSLSTGVRASDLHRMGSQIQVDRDSFSLPYLEKTKTGIFSTFTVQPLVGSDRICPFAAYVRYLKASTDSCRENKFERSPFLFVSATDGARVKIATLRNWLVFILQKAGVISTAGSIRSATTSSAWWRGKSFDVIASLAGWKRESTFQKFYKKPILAKSGNLLNV